jgi:diguanylate cyclase (GGDEF)-like protein
MLIGLAGLLAAALATVHPQAALPVGLLLDGLPVAAALPLLDRPAAPVVALLLPLALDRLLGDWFGRARSGVQLTAGLVTGVLVGALEPALLVSLAIILWHADRRRRAAGASTLDDPSTASAGRSEVDGFLTIARDGLIVSADARALEFLGGQPIGRPLGRYLPRLDLEGRPIEALLGQRLETELQHESTRFRPVEVEIHRAPGGGRAAARVRLTDISARAERLAELERMALHDALTGLPNRALFHDRVRQSIASAERHGESFVVMLLDLDRFKQVNDTLGHQIGDRLLQAVGPRLGAVLRRSDTLARLGGDEFAVILPPPVDIDHAAATAERLVESMREPFQVDGMTLDLGVSVGTALYPEHGTDLETLVHNADVAMYKAKREQLGFSIFNAEQAVGSARRLMLQRDLRPAIEQGDLEVLVQPKLAVAGWTVTGAEALVRWHHPVEGLLAPDDFLPIAEHTGLIVPLTLQVLNDCLEAQRRWRRAGVELPVSMNVSTKWLRDREFPKILNLALRNWHGRPNQLILEVPENAVMLDPGGTLETLEAVARLGVGIVLDHFGTGYSSLPLLQRLPITALKIDRTFVGDLFEERSASVVVRSIVKLAHGLGLRVIASGVESERAADHLAAIGCDEIQGYFVAHPMPVDRLPSWLAARAERRYSPA